MFKTIQQLIRKCEDELYRMAYCSFALKEWAACLRDIETALTVHPNNAGYELLKMKALVACYGNCKTWHGEVIEECFKVLKNMELEKIGDLRA